MKLNILAIGVHPDDVELSCTGTLLKHIDLGYQIGILDLTKGELGTKGNVESRRLEAVQAAKIQGIAVRDQAGLADGFFENNKENLLKVIPFIRKYQPDIILANAIDDRHPDHGRAAKLIADACFYSGLIKIQTDMNGENQAAWRPKALYHYVQDRHLHPDFVIDITPYIHRKIEAIMAFESQFYNPNDDGPVTPISQKNFIDALKGKNAVFGRSIGVDYAEGFTYSRIPGVKDLFDLQ